MNILHSVNKRFLILLFDIFFGERGGGRRGFGGICLLVTLYNDILKLDNKLAI